LPIADTAATLFYDRLFEIDPSTRPLFQSADMPAQRKKLVQALAFVVGSIDQLGAVVPALADLGRRHVHYGVADQHYASVGAALLWTLEQGLGERWSPEVRDAWGAAYQLIAEVMCEGAKTAAPIAAE
jgi:nitric oxide dioxygenase